ncbi:hypothetical protein JCM10207_000999 [Rhodosporidiobolus poonsookiae]
MSPSSERAPLLPPASDPARSPAYASLSRASSASKSAPGAPRLPPDPAATPAAAGRGSPVEDEDDDAAEEDDADADLSPAQRRRKLVKWFTVWTAVAAGVLYLIFEAFHRGGGKFDWEGALKKAAGGGVAGALAMIVQVLALMPLRTVMNYQYRYGTSTTEASRKLYAEGGFGRYYAGLGPALVQGPVARFGDTFSNAGVLALLASNPFLSHLPSPVKTAIGSLLGALFRMVLMPVDTLKTTMQTQGSAPALVILKERVKRYGPGTLWAGAFGAAASNFVGSFPWFAAYNYLSTALPPAPPLDSPLHPHWQLVLLKLGRQAFIGFAASVVSDTCSNSLRVVKTYRQVSRRKVGYRQAATHILRTEGARGLFGRGLKTRLLANGLQGLLFSVLWKAIGEALQGGGDGKGDGK